MVNQKFSGEEESQRLFEALQKLEEGLSSIEAEEAKALSDPDLRELVTQLEIARIVLEVNDQQTKDLQQELNAKIGAIRSERQAYRKQFGSLYKELESLTKPIIRELTMEFIEHRQRAKLSSEILSKEYNGLRKTVILTVRSNKSSIINFRSKVDAAIATIEKMHRYPTSEIKEKGNLLLREIQDFDWKVETVQKVDESDYFRGSSAPAGATPASMTYGGPLSGNL